MKRADCVDILKSRKLRGTAYITSDLCHHMENSCGNYIDILALLNKLSRHYM